MAAARPSLASASVRAIITKLLVGASIDGSFDAIHHLAGGNKFLAGTVPATFGAHLVFNMHCRDTCFDHRPNCSRNIEGAAPAGIDVHQQRKCSCVGNTPGIGQHVFHGADAQVRKREGICRHSAAGEIECPETSCLSQARRIGVDCARYL